MRQNICRLGLLLLLVLTSVGWAGAQTMINVSGTVTDADNSEALIGVSIKVKGTSSGAVTDLDGHYALTVQKGASLEFSYIGYAVQEAKANAAVINIALKSDTKALEEVVVVGYGVQKKSSLTGAVSQVKAEDMENRTAVSLSSAISGKTTGITSFSTSAAPGAAPAVQVRGISSNGSSSPLWVIDGRTTENPGALDPGQIESIEILKDGASAAIYGARAGNGVILVTTKKGKGSGTVSLDVMLTSQSVRKLPKVLNSEQYADYYIEAGSLTPTAIYNYWDFHTNTDWADQTLEPSLMQKYTLKFSGSNDRGSLFTSLSFLDDNGMVKGDKDTYRRYSGMINADYKINDWLKIGTTNNIDYGSTKAVLNGSGSENVFSAMLWMDPMTPAYYAADNINSKMALYASNPSKYGKLLTDRDGYYYGLSGLVTTDAMNPLIIRDMADQETRSFSVAGTAYADLTPFKGFRFTSRLAYNFSSAESRSVKRPYVSDYDSSRYFPTYSVSAGVANATYWQWENFANYNHTWGKHDVTAMAGISYSENRSYSVSGSVQGDANGSLGFLRDDPLFLYFGYANPDAMRTIAGGEPIYSRKFAYFGRLSYDYDGKYLAQVAMRADAADLSVLPKDNRWGYFPSASVGWVVSKEKFMEWARPTLDFLKLRASWGKNGSTSSLGNYMYGMTIQNIGYYNFSNDLNYQYGYRPSAIGNKELKWETSEQWDFGVDMRLFNSRLNIGVDYFNKTTKDLIVSGATLSMVAGYASPPVNSGSIKNSGVEIELGWRDHIGDFNYSVRGNIGTLKNRVTKVNDNISTINGACPVNMLRPVTRFEKDHPAWYFYGYKYLGVNPDTGDAIYWDKNKDGQISPDDKTDIGSGIPTLTFGLTLTAAWKGFDLLVFGSGASGFDIFNFYNISGTPVNMLQEFALNRWTPEHTNAKYPHAKVYDIDSQESSSHVFKGDYFKIKQIQLGYTLPKKALKSLHLQSLRVYASLDDFFCFTSYLGFDPEVVGFGNATGIDYGLYPNSRKMTFGLNLSF